MDNEDRTFLFEKLASLSRFTGMFNNKVDFAQSILIGLVCLYFMATLVLIVRLKGGPREDQFTTQMLEMNTNT